MPVWLKPTPIELGLNPLLTLDQASPRHKLSYLIALLILWQLVPKYRNYINQAKIGLLRTSLNIDDSQHAAECDIFKTHYAELYRIACYYVSIHSAIHYHALLQQQQFSLQQVRSDDFFPKANWFNLMQLGKNTLVTTIVRWLRRS